MIVPTVREMLLGPIPRKMGSMLQIEQYYTVRVRVREVDVPDPVPDAMGSRPIASGTSTFNWSLKHFSEQCETPPLPDTIS